MILLLAAIGYGIYRAKGQIIDVWTLVHVATGWVLARLGLSFFPVLGLLLGFEVVEAWLRKLKTGGVGLFAPESHGNIVADILAGCAGYVIGRY